MSTTLFRDNRGVSLTLTAISMVVILGMAALAIDVGMLYEAKAQAQNAADSGALAGAGALLLTPDDATVPTNVAETFAEKHEIIRQQVQIVPGEDVDVDLVNQQVTVTARRIAARGNAVPTFFARILGWDLVDIVAVATAEIQTGGAAACLKPWAIPDAYDDIAPVFGQYDPGDYYEPGVTSWGTNYRTNDGDFGFQLTLKYGRPGDAIASGQFFPIDLPQPNGDPVAGGDRYRENIANCNTQIVNVGDMVWTETGNMIGPTKQGVQALIDQDPGARWTSSGLTSSAFAPGASPRIVRVPMFDPRYPPTSGKQQIQITNIAGFFIEGVTGNGNVTGRLMPTIGVPGTNTGPFVQSLRLVR